MCGDVNGEPLYWPSISRDEAMTNRFTKRLANWKVSIQKQCALQSGRNVYRLVSRGLPSFHIEGHLGQRSWMKGWPHGNGSSG